MTDTQAYLKGWADVARQVQDGLTETKAHELARTARLQGCWNTPTPWGEAYWQGVSAGVAAALGV